MRDIAGLNRFLADRAAMPFAWGDRRNDCVSFAAGAVAAQGGRRVRFGGHRWTSARGAALVLRRVGGLQAAVTRELALVPMAFAQRGDIAAVEGPDGLVLMVVEGDMLAGPDRRGIRRLPRSAMVMAWSAL